MDRRALLEVGLMSPAITAAAPTTALRMRKLRRSLPAGISGVRTSGVMPRRSSTMCGSVIDRGSSGELLLAISSLLSIKQLLLAGAQRPHRALAMHRGSVVFHDWGPGVIGIEEFRTLENLKRLRPEIFLIDHAVVANHEGFHAGIAVLSRGSD